jgi:hypothetical protein
MTREERLKAIQHMDAAPAAELGMSNLAERWGSSKNETPKRSRRPGGRNVGSGAKFPTRRPGGIHEMPPVPRGFETPAHEHLGELYLVLGNRPKAEQQLATLASPRTIVAGSRVNRRFVGCANWPPRCSITRRLDQRDVLLLQARCCFFGRLQNQSSRPALRTPAAILSASAASLNGKRPT